MRITLENVEMIDENGVLKNNEYGMFMKKSDTELKVYAGAYLNGEKKQAYLFSTKEVVSCNYDEEVINNIKQDATDLLIYFGYRNIEICSYDANLFDIGKYVNRPVYYKENLIKSRYIGTFKILRDNKNKDYDLSCSKKLLLANERALNKKLEKINNIQKEVEKED